MQGLARQLGLVVAKFGVLKTDVAAPGGGHWIRWLIDLRIEDAAQDVAEEVKNVVEDAGTVK